MEKITVKVDDKEYNCIVPNGNDNIIINDKPQTIKILKKITSTVYSISVNNRVFIVDLQEKENDFMQVYADGFMFDVEVTNESKKLIKKYLKEYGGDTDSGYAQIKAPMPGMVIKVHINVGDTVNKGDKILIIEAMKMENAVSSPISGVVKTVNAIEGKGVEKDELLIEIEGNK
jgi:biotin carboxyl carrier protein